MIPTAPSTPAAGPVPSSDAPLVEGDHFLRWLAVVLALAMLAGMGCRTVYYKTMEGFGQEKRDLLQSRLSDARDAARSMRDDLAKLDEQLSAVATSAAGEQARRYDRLNEVWEDARHESSDLADANDDVERVGRDMLREWKKELPRFSDPALREQSRDQLDETTRRFDAALASLRRAEKAVAPALRPVHDQVLVLKHGAADTSGSYEQSSLASGQAGLRDAVAAIDAGLADLDAFASFLRE